MTETTGAIRSLGFALMVLTTGIPTTGTYHHQDAQGIVIDGRTHPDSIPRHAVWESFFRFLADFAYVDGEIDDSSLDALARHNLNISVGDTRILASKAKQAISDVETIRKPLNDEHETGRTLDWSKEKRQAQVDESFQAVLRVVDDLKREVSVESMQAIERYVKTEVVPGMKYWVQ